MPQFTHNDSLQAITDFLKDNVFAGSYIFLFDNNSGRGYMSQSTFELITEREGVNKLVLSDDITLDPFYGAGDYDANISRSGIGDPYDPLGPAFIIRLSVGNRHSNAEVRLPNLSIPVGTLVKLNMFELTVPYGTI